MRGTCTNTQIDKIKSAIIDNCGFEPGSDTQYQKPCCNKQRNRFDTNHDCAYDNFDPIGSNKGYNTHCDIENYSLSAAVVSYSNQLKRTDFDNNEIKKFNPCNTRDTLPIGHPKGWSSYPNCYK